jgi:hypothetical protein
MLPVCICVAVNDLDQRWSTVALLTVMASRKSPGALCCVAGCTYTKRAGTDEEAGHQIQI